MTERCETVSVFEYAKRHLLKSGYKVVKSGPMAVLLQKENNRILMWKTEEYDDSYNYLFFRNGNNVSFHKRGFSVREYDPNAHRYVDGGTYDVPEYVLGNGRHFGNHATFEGTLNILLRDLK